MKKSHRGKNRRILISVIVTLCVLLVGEAAFILTHPSQQKSDRVCTGELPSRQVCLQGEIQTAIKRRDIEGALSRISELHAVDPSAGGICHSMTHEIGKAAYTLFAHHISFEVTEKTAYCSYGFYHGFMEALVGSGNSMTVAREFCAYIDRQISAESPDANLQCYHGIGHGVVNNHDPRTWGDPNRLVNPALSLCEQASDDQEELQRCATGVFNGLSVFYSTGEYGLKPDLRDPLGVCRIQNPAYQDACFISMNTLLLELSGGDFARAAQYADTIPDDLMAQHTILNIAAPLASDGRDADVLGVCRALAPRLRMSCIAGYAFGFLEHGPPGTEYVKALKFCEWSELNTEEQNACFEYIFTYLPKWYSSAKNQAICRTVTDHRRAACRSGGKEPSGL